MSKNVVGRVSVFLFLLALCFALAGCGQAVSEEEISVQIDGKPVSFLFRSRTDTQATDIWEELPVYGELKDAAPIAAPGEHRIGIDFSGCAFPEWFAAYGYRGGVGEDGTDGGVGEDGTDEVKYGDLAIGSCEQSENVFTLRFTSQASAYADEMAIFVFHMQWPAGASGLQEVWMYVGCFTGGAA